MTKKSASRLMRDKQRADEAARIKAEGRKGWDEVRALAESCTDMLALPVLFEPHLKNKVLLAFLSQEERVELANSVKLLSKDLMGLLEAIKPIREAHAGKSGHEAHFGELMQALDIVTQYQNWQTQYDAIILPTKADIIQHISNAEQRMMEKAREVQAQKAAEEKAAASTEATQEAVLETAEAK